MHTTYCSWYPWWWCVLWLSLVCVSQTNVQYTQSHTQQEVEHYRELAQTTPSYFGPPSSGYFINISLEGELFKGFLELWFRLYWGYGLLSIYKQWLFFCL